MHGPTQRGREGAQDEFAGTAHSVRTVSALARFAPRAITLLVVALIVAPVWIRSGPALLKGVVAASVPLIPFGLRLGSLVTPPAAGPKSAQPGAPDPALVRGGLICFAFCLFARFRRSRAGPHHVLLHV
ncbi:hypothetical protein [Streptomyces sp. SM11]|uniref:hypothetical protein n=1 Tax=Streptomyces sp. SM11 TaxID=565557 RepID=UPI0015E16941|nr:hypothetical protein [Streptomyces sp. SM11]